MAALSALAAAALPAHAVAQILAPNSPFGALLGVAAGSIASGHPLTSYVLAGELLSAGVGIVAVTALIISWVTVGIVQLPAEAAFLGLGFAIWRNAVCFVSAIAIAYLAPFLAELAG